MDRRGFLRSLLTTTAAAYTVPLLSLLPEVEMVAVKATDFGALTQAQKTVWSRDLWAMASSKSFLDKFTDNNSVVDYVARLERSEAGPTIRISLREGMSDVRAV